MNLTWFDDVHTSEEGTTSFVRAKEESNDELAARKTHSRIRSIPYLLFRVVPEITAIVDCHKQDTL